jgi:hypothetical protein
MCAWANVKARLIVSHNQQLKELVRNQAKRGTALLW